jgi:hypothetical protein
MSKKDVLGTMSPIYGLMSGHGAFGKMADAGIGGIIPTALADRRRGKREEAEEAARLATAGSPVIQAPTAGMKKGGSVGSASRRADGVAAKGKTKGKFV